MNTICLKLLVDTKNNRVVFAEAEKDFLNTLLSFLTFPMGTIISILGKQSGVGCIDKLYESIENLNTNCFETGACKTMLLNPLNSAEHLFSHRPLYICSEFDFCSIYSSICDARCPNCGSAMDEEFHQPDVNVGGDVFVKGADMYIISDDLHVDVAPTTTEGILSLYQARGIEDAKHLEERFVYVTGSEVSNLLKSLLQSKTPLTDVFLRKTESVFSEYELTDTAQFESENEYEAATSSDDQSKTTRLKILESKITKRIVYTEAGNDFRDVLLSFLTFPLGSIIKLLNKQSSLGCVDNLYHSAEALSITNDCIKSEECKDMLQSPKLYPHFSCSNQVLRIEEKMSGTLTIQRCDTCWNDFIPPTTGETKCKHNIDYVVVTALNPEMLSSGQENGGGYANKSGRFLVTSELVISPLLPISGTKVIKKHESPFDSFVEKEVELREPEVLDLLKACLMSSDALSNVLSSSKRRKLL